MRESRVSAGCGLVVWLLLFAIRPVGFGDEGLIERLVLFAVLVCAPLVLELVRTPDRRGRLPWAYRTARWLQPVSAALVTIAFFLPAGAAAGLLSLPWMACTLVIALIGLVRFLPRGVWPVEELCIDAGLVYLPIGGAWLLTHRFGIDPFAYGAEVNLLTAIHFHFSGFLVPMLAGLAGRQLMRVKPELRGAFAWLAAGAMISPIFVGIGIAAGHALELVSVIVFVLTLLLLSLLTLLMVYSTIRHRAGRLLLGVSSSTVLISMFFAFLFGVGQYTGRPVVTIPQMVAVHGALNALGFSFCGLLAWVLAGTQATVPSPGIPFSRLSSGGRVGAGFFHRIGAVAQLAEPPVGLIDDLDEYARGDFEPRKVHPEIRDFYEETKEYKLLVHPKWRRGFRIAARLFKRMSVRLEQLNFPMDAEVKEDLMDSRILPIRDEIDGRSKVRAWIRTFAATGLPIYVAAYSTHVMDGERYMNIAFPLPGGNMTSILHIEPLAGRAGEAQGLLLTTLPRRGRVGDQGVYFANRCLPVRLPINESIYVWPVGMSTKPGGFDQREIEPSIVARHDMWLFGIKCLTLDYYITRRRG